MQAALINEAMKCRLINLVIKKFSEEIKNHINPV